MVGLPGHVVNVLLLLGHIGPQDFPVVATVLQPDLSVQLLDEVLSDPRGASENGQVGMALPENVLHDGSVSVQEVKVFHGEATVVEHPDPLLKREAASAVALDQGLVSHEEGAHHLEHGDLDREVEGRDHADRSQRPSVARAELALMVSGNSEGLSEEANLVATEVLEKGPGHPHLSLCLHPALGDTPNNQVNEVVEDGLVVEDLRRLPAHLAQHQIPLLVLEGVVETVLGHRLQALNEGHGLVYLCVGDLDHGFAGHRVDQSIVVLDANPFSVNEV
mmetsp:Transcript_1119/g.2054  ORF Transcript_1119/g.2054 Transcript_1119/m.2054 type:complete len:277 (+) Transcript_1119:811-1641(+)